MNKRNKTTVEAISSPKTTQYSSRMVKKVEENETRYPEKIRVNEKCHFGQFL